MTLLYAQHDTTDEKSWAEGPVAVSGETGQFKTASPTSYGDSMVQKKLSLYQKIARKLVAHPSFNK